MFEILFVLFGIYRSYDYLCGDMKKWVFIIGVVLLLLSCEHSKRRSTTFESYRSKPVRSVMRVDSTLPLEEPRVRSTSSAGGGASVGSRSSGVSSSRREVDNMRGWDPASEDDMDDNGIDRYMENNDEEGWD